MRDWLGFDDPEDQEDAEREQDKEWEADDVSEDDGEQDEQSEEANDGTIFPRISEEIKDISWKFFDIC